MNVRNYVRKHFMTDPPLTHRPVTPCSISTIGHTQYSARGVDADALPGQGFDDREPPFGRIFSSLISQHRRCELCSGKLFFQSTNPPSRVSELHRDRDGHTGKLSNITVFLDKAEDTPTKLD
jgi:hypothetical protein